MDVIGDAIEGDPVRPADWQKGWRGDLICALRDGLIALGATVAAAILCLVIVIYAGASHLHVGAGDFFSLGVWLTGTSLGVPLHLTSTETISSHYSLTEHIQLRVIVWLLTAIMLILVFRLARRSERAQPSGSMIEVAIRVLLTAAVVTVALLVLSLLTHGAGVFGVLFGEDATGTKTTVSVGLEPGYVFAGPLLLSIAAALAGRWPGSGGSAAAWSARVAEELNRWRLVLRTAFRQSAVTGGLAGITLFVYASVNVTRHTDARETAAIVFGLLLLLPNLAIYGTLASFGTTFYGTSRTTGLSGDSGPLGGTYSVGIFGSHQVWIVWLLLAFAVAGTLIPALLARRTGRLDRTVFPVTGTWRAALTGLVAAVAVCSLGVLSEVSSQTSPFIGLSGSIRATISAGPSLLDAAGLSALWFAVGYLAAAVAVRRASSDARQDAPR